MLVLDTDCNQMTASKAYTPHTKKPVRDEILNMQQSWVGHGFRPCSYWRNIPGHWLVLPGPGLSVNVTTWVMSVYTDA